MADKEGAGGLSGQVWGKKSKDLGAAIYDDWKRQAVDNAKKRAAAQNVDYPTFANLVSVAHLKPVERPKPGQDEEQLSHVYKGKAPAWSFGPTGTNTPLTRIKQSDEEDDEAAGAAAVALERMAAPGRGGRTAPGRKMTRDVFAKEWRRLGKDVLLKAVYLTGIEPREYPEIFKVEVPPPLMADILETVCTCFRADVKAHGSPELERLLRDTCSRDVGEAWATSMLEAMAACGRFALAVGLLGEKTRAMVRALVGRLRNTAWCQTPEDAGGEAPRPSRPSRLQNVEKLYHLG